MYAGEHTAGTEFMIGPLFLLAGVTLPNIIFGLLVGNLMAVLSWRYLCAPIATKARLTLYYHLEKIARARIGQALQFRQWTPLLFPSPGAMITVSATAVGIPFEIPMPTLDDTLPNNVPFVIITLLVGAVIAIVASRGLRYRRKIFQCRSTLDGPRLSGLRSHCSKATRGFQLGRTHCRLE